MFIKQNKDGSRQSTFLSDPGDFLKEDLAVWRDKYKAWQASLHVGQAHEARAKCEAILYSASNLLQSEKSAQEIEDQFTSAREQATTRLDGLQSVIQSLKEASDQHLQNLLTVVSKSLAGDKWSYIISGAGHELESQIQNLVFMLVCELLKKLDTENHTLQQSIFTLLAKFKFSARDFS